MIFLPSSHPHRLSVHSRVWSLSGCGSAVSYYCYHLSYTSTLNALRYQVSFTRAHDCPVVESRVGSQYSLQHSRSLVIHYGRSSTGAAHATEEISETLASGADNISEHS